MAHLRCVSKPTSGDGVVSGNVRVNVHAGMDEGEIAVALAAAINGTTTGLTGVTASPSGGSVVLGGISAHESGRSL